MIEILLTLLTFIANIAKYSAQFSKKFEFWYFQKKFSKKSFGYVNFTYHNHAETIRQNAGTMLLQLKKAWILEFFSRKKTICSKKLLWLRRLHQWQSCPNPSAKSIKKIAQRSKKAMKCGFYRKTQSSSIWYSGHLEFSFDKPLMKNISPGRVECPFKNLLENLPRKIGEKLETKSQISWSIYTFLRKNSVSKSFLWQVETKFDSTYEKFSSIVRSFSSKKREKKFLERKMFLTQKFFVHTSNKEFSSRLTFFCQRPKNFCSKSMKIFKITAFTEKSIPIGESLHVGSCFVTKLGTPFGDHSEGLMLNVWKKSKILRAPKKIQNLNTFLWARWLQLTLRTFSSNNAKHFLLNLRKSVTFDVFQQKNSSKNSSGLVNCTFHNHAETIRRNTGKMLLKLEKKTWILENSFHERKLFAQKSYSG